MGGSGNGPIECGSTVQRPKLDGLEKIDLDALTGEISDKHLSVAFKNAVDSDILQNFGEPSICLTLVKMLVTQGFIRQTLEARAYIKRAFSDFCKAKKHDCDWTECAEHLISLIELELVRNALNMGLHNLGIKLADQIRHKESRAMAFVMIFLAQKAGTNGGTYR